MRASLSSPCSASRREHPPRRRDSPTSMLRHRHVALHRVAAAPVRPVVLLGRAHLEQLDAAAASSASISVPGHSTPALVPGAEEQRPRRGAGSGRARRPRWRRYRAPAGSAGRARRRRSERRPRRPRRRATHTARRSEAAALLRAPSRHGRRAPGRRSRRPLRSRWSGSRARGSCAPRRGGHRLEHERERARRLGGICVVRAGGAPPAPYCPARDSRPAGRRLRRSPRWATTGMPAPERAERASIGPAPSSFTACAAASFRNRPAARSAPRAHLVRHERQVGEDQGPAGTRARPLPRA